MLNAIIGTKQSQSQQFTSDGRRIPVTFVKTGPLTVVSIKEAVKNGYFAVLLGLGNRRISTLTKPEIGVLKKSGLDKNPPRFLSEIRMEEIKPEDLEQLSPGTQIQAGSIFQTGDIVQVSGISKGKGFQGVVKRHHFKGGSRTHGQSDRERAPGSIGQTTTPGRVYKGKRMAGRMGNDLVTIKRLKVVAIDDEKKLLTLSGLVPGGRNTVVMIKKM